MSYPFKPNPNLKISPTRKRPYGAALAGLTLTALLALAAQASAGGVAAVTLGLPHAQITVGNTWGNGDREVVTEAPAVVPAGEEVVYDDDAPRHIIVHREYVRPQEQVVVEPAFEPVIYHPGVRVIREYPRYGSRGVYVRPNHRVIYGRPEHRVVFAPHRETIVHGVDRGHFVGHSGIGGSNVHGGSSNLFPQSSGRPSIQRGVQR